MLTMTLTPTTRSPRFRRPQTPPLLQRTERDLDIIRTVTRLRFATAAQIARTIGGSEKKVIERVGQLYYFGDLDRPPRQLDYYRAGGGSSPIVYALAKNGARVLIEHDGREDADVDWARKNNEATRRFIKHTLGVADISVAFTEAVRTRPHLVLQHPINLARLMPAATQQLVKPFKLRVTVHHNGQRADIGVVADLPLGIVYSDKSPRYFLIENDEGTMPVERHNLRQTSILRKCLAYETARKLRLHERQFGWKHFRVLIVTNTPARATNIRAMIARTHQLKSSPLFLVADKPSFDTAADVLEHRWLDAAGKPHTLI
jgi:hypothetical protein